MTDREMLELAAKAAGFETAEWQDLAGWGEVRYGLSEAIWNGEDYWNPLCNDGDALRLAVKLMIPMQYPDWQRVTRTWGPVGHGEPFDEPHDRDPYAATRRAIVRAAAAIGEAVP